MVPSQTFNLGEGGKESAINPFWACTGHNVSLDPFNPINGNNPGNIYHAIIVIKTQNVTKIIKLLFIQFISKIIIIKPVPTSIPIQIQP